MSWRRKNCIHRDAWTIYMYRSPHVEALGKKEVHTTDTIVSKHAYHHQLLHRIGTASVIPLALPRHVSTIGVKVKDISTVASGNKQRHCSG